MKIEKPKYKKIDKQQLKPKRNPTKAKTKGRDKNRLQCPNCLSLLKVTADGSLECTGNKLRIWESEFIKYDNLKTQDEKAQYLHKISNKDKFLELYEKRFNLECGYTNRIINPTPTYTVAIPDPLMVGMIEKSLGRSLTDEELEDGYKFYSDGVNFYTEPGPYRQSFTLDRVNFPDDC